jgi:hypothetical protein
MRSVARRRRVVDHRLPAAVILFLGLLLLAGIAPPVRAVVTGTGPAELLLDPRAGRLYTYLAYDNRILALELDSGALIGIVPDVGIPGNRNEGTGIRALALDGATGRLFAMNSAERGPAGQDWTLYAVDAARGAVVQQVSLGLGLSLPYEQLLADPVHGKLYAVGEGTTTVFDAVTLEAQRSLPGGLTLLLDRRGDRLYLLDRERLAVFSAADGTLQAELSRPEGAFLDMALDHSRQRLFLALDTGIHVLDTVDQQWLDPLAGRPTTMQCIAVDPLDGEVYVVGLEEGLDPLGTHLFVLSPETGERRATIAFREPAGHECLGYMWTSVRRLVPAPAGGRIYGSGNAMARCTPEANLAFVLDTQAETLIEWLPRWPDLPGSGGTRPGGVWLIWAGAGLLVCGLLLPIVSHYLSKRSRGRCAGHWPSG